MLSLTKEGFAVKIGKLFSKEGAVDALASIGALRFQVSSSTVLHISMLVTVLVIAAVIRLLPLRWGMQLSEFDPHFHYRLARHMVDNGLFAWTEWTDMMSWYPYGLNVASLAYPGLAATAATMYQVASALNLAPAPIFSSAVYHPLTADPLFNFCIIFPVIMATLTVLVIYFVGRDIGGKAVGLFSAFFLALSSAYISRTSAGFFDDETIGIFAILLFIFFFLRSIDPKISLRNVVIYAVAGGLSLGYMFASWGAARYALGITLVFVFVLLLLKRYSTRLLISYGLTFAVSLAIAATVPRLGLSFLVEPTVLAVAAMFLVLIMFETSRRIKTDRSKLFFVIGFLALIVSTFVALHALGLTGNLGSKFWAVLFPSERMGEGTLQQLIQSVQEHRPATWGSFYYDVGLGAFFIPLGLFFAVYNPTNRNIFLAIFGLTAIYFAGSMVRLTLLLAPAFSLLWALALVQVAKPFVTILRTGPQIPRRKMRFKPRVGKEFSAGFILLLFLLIVSIFVLPSSTTEQPRVVARAFSPTTIAASSLPLRYSEPISDWLDALNWLRYDTDPSSVVASWWDYGYWIRDIGNRTTLADNGTGNVTQIAGIGEMFMSNETVGTAWLKEYDVDYVVIFHTFRTDGSDAVYGDEGKWRWMANIPGLNSTRYGNYTLGQDWFDEDANGQVDDGELVTNVLGTNTILYKLMHYSRDIVLQGSSSIELDNFLGPPSGYFSQPIGNPQGYSDGSGTFIAMVCVFQVVY
jgi:dolichyl-diphosphooligosaccharide--protein glycosyltransferase